MQSSTLMQSSTFSECEKCRFRPLLAFLYFATLGVPPEATHLDAPLGHDGPARLARVPLVDHVEAADHDVARQLRHAL